MSKLSRNILVTASASVIALAAIAAGILKAGTATYDTEKLADAHKYVSAAMYEYVEIKNNAYQDSADTLKTDKKYKAQVKKQDRLARRLFRGTWNMPKQEFIARCEKFDKMSEQTDSMAEALRAAHMAKNPDIHMANMRIAEAKAWLKKVQRDSVIADSLNRLPAGRRFVMGWNNICNGKYGTSVGYIPRQLMQRQK